MQSMIESRPSQCVRAHARDQFLKTSNRCRGYELAVKAVKTALRIEVDGEISPTGANPVLDAQHDHTRCDQVR
jgi:hypothetical protein